MAKSVALIGIDPGELRWVRLLLQLLRHPDPARRELARQALRYLAETAHLHAEPDSQSLDHAG